MSKLTKKDLEKYRKEAIEKDKANLELFKKEHDNLMELGDFFDEYGYPTNKSLSLVEIWHYSDPKGWFDFIEKIWNLKSFGWNILNGGKDEWTGQQIPENTIRYYISTAGWSGNEQIIERMKTNESLWYNTWVQSRRGGHYIFEIENDD